MNCASMDRYTEIKKIGEGSFGKAILVKHKDNGNQFVVKEIGISKMQAKERNEARKEVSVLSKMRHPNIVQYVESFEENGKLYIVMEYCEGGDLYALINKQRGVMFTERQVLDWFVQICLALKHVHDRKILHRDIKTSNIFLTKSGLIKLGDFGIARVLNNTMELARTCIGTPYYLSPEICENKPYNNKSDVWALGCVVYEILTLKHAFEAGNMKNLVLKIIRGSYPPIPSRYSHDLRSLISQLFRRNPRERPSVNSILKKTFISSLTVRFLSPEVHESEFSHTVIHKRARKPPSRPSSAVSHYQPVAEKRMRNLEVRGAPRNPRNQQIAAAYGPSVAAKRQQRPSVGRPPKVANAQKAANDVLEKRQKMIEQQQQKKEKILAEKKKRLEDLQRRQKERAQKMYEEKLKRDRDAARVLNLQRSAEILDDNEDNVARNEDNMGVAARNRPTSAPPKREDYNKYHQYLDKLERGDRYGAANSVAPSLSRVKQAWEERNKAQNAILDAQINRLNKAAGEEAAGRAQVVNEYLQRRQEAVYNKQKGNNDLYRNGNSKQPKFGVAGALQPFAARPKATEEQQYLDRLQQIRMQNYHERRALQNKHMENYKVVEADPSSVSDEEMKKKKVNALQQQANDRARMLQQNMEEKRRIMLDAGERNLGQEKKKKFDEKARARGIIPPDERPVKYNPAPIGITQALHAVGAPILNQETNDDKQDESVSSPSKLPDSDIRRQILQRVNQRFSVDLDEEEKINNLNKKIEDGPLRALPSLPNKKPVIAEKPIAWKAWGPGGDIGQKISQLPLQETASQMDATSAVVKPPTKPKWSAPSQTIVNKLNQMTINEPTITMPPEKETEPTMPPSVDTNEAEQAKMKEIKFVNKTVILEKKKSSSQQIDEDVKHPGKIQLAPKFVPKGTFVIKKSPAKTEESSSDEEIEEVVMLEDVLKDQENVLKDQEDAPKDQEDVLKDQKDAPKDQEDALKDQEVVLKDQEDVLKDQEDVLKDQENVLKDQEDSVKVKSAWDEKMEDQEDSVKLKSAWDEKLEDQEEDKNKDEKDSQEELKPSTPPKRPLPPTPGLSGSPFFTKRNENVDKMMATSPVKPVKMETPKSDHLSKSLYLTASDQVLMKITLGQFDSPSPKLLRTCSLPDLTKISEEDPSRSVDVPPDDLPRISVASSMNDTNFDEEEDIQDLESTASGCHDDDEEMEMRAQLENALHTTAGSSPPHSSGFPASNQLIIDNDEDASDDEWESGSSSSFDDGDKEGKTPDSDSESVFSRLERNREQLERELGFDAFLNAYKSVQAIHEDEDEEVARCQERVRKLLGPKFDEIYPRILQLVMADGAYCEDND